MRESIENLIDKLGEGNLTSSTRRIPGPAQILIPFVQNIYIHICSYVCICTISTFTSTTNLNLYVHLRLYPYLPLNLHLQLHLCLIYTCIHVSSCICIYIHVYLCFQINSKTKWGLARLRTKLLISVVKSLSRISENLPACELIRLSL